MLDKKEKKTPVKLLKMPNRHDYMIISLLDLFDFPADL